MLGQITPGQAFDVKILNPDPTETLDQIAGKLVQVITPSVCGTGVMLRQNGDTFCPGLGTPFAPSNSPLTAAQSFGRLPRPVWSRLGLGVAQGDEAAKPDVDSDTVRPGTIDSGDIDVEYDVPLPVLPRQDRRCRLGRQFSGPADLDVAGDTYEAKTTVLADCEAIPTRNSAAWVPGTCSVPWDPGLAPRFTRPKKALNDLSRRRNTCCSAV
jgi:hypothetical protein